MNEVFFFEELLQSEDDAITIVDTEKKVIYWNNAAEQTYQITKEQIIDQSITDFFSHDDLMVMKVLRTMKPVKNAYHRPRKDKHVVVNTSPVFNQENTLIGVISIERDVTHIVKLNDNLESTSQELQELKQKMSPSSSGSPFAKLVGESQALHQMIRLASKTADTDATTLILGESGTGKEVCARAIHDAGKPWDQADGDIAEGIDFLEYYGRQMLELDQGKHVEDRITENNKYFYKAMGPGVVIPPWNFAFAIVCGTVAAPIVAGNPVLLKPSENTPVIAYKLVEVLEEAGLPKGVLNFVSGDPKEIGDYLVDHKDTHFINFTGSRATGVRIFERAAKIQEGQQHLKRVIAEMGGKDTIIVDETADLDLAAESIVHSAFGFSGQKCSACSRAIIHENVYDEVIEKSIEIAKTLTVGNPSEENVYMASVINQTQFDKIKNYIEIGKEEGELVFGGEADDTKGFFIYPTIFKDLDPKARIMQEEIFGPVVAFAKAKDFDELLEIANNTEYGLTGAVISTNRAHLERAREDFHVGNLYFNRGCTAAIVGYQPFGGFKMSGTDSKAGGPDYLQHFLEAKIVSEQF